MHTDFVDFLFKDAVLSQIFNLFNVEAGIFRSKMMRVFFSKEFLKKSECGSRPNVKKFCENRI